MEGEYDSSAESTPSFCRSVSSASSSFSSRSQDDTTTTDSPIFMDLEFKTLTKVFLSPLQKTCSVTLFNENIPVASLSPKRPKRVHSEAICSPVIGTPFAVVEVVDENAPEKDAKSSRVRVSSNVTWIKGAGVFFLYLLVLAGTYYSKVMNLNGSSYPVAASTESSGSFASTGLYWTGESIENTLAIYRSVSDGFDHPNTFWRTISSDQYAKPAPVFSRRLKATSRLVSKEALDRDFLAQALKSNTDSVAPHSSNTTRVVYVIKPFTLRVTGKVSPLFRFGLREMSSRLMSRLKAISSEVARQVSARVRSFWKEHMAPMAERKKLELYGDLWFRQSRKVVKI